MSSKNSRLIVPVAVVLGCLTLFVVLAVLASQSSTTDESAASGFPIALAGLAVVAVVGAVVWRAVSRKKSDHR